MKNYIVYQNENAIYYECNYSCDNAIFLKLGSESYFFTDSRYEIEAKSALEDVEVIIAKDLLAALIKVLKKSQLKRVTIDPQEWNLGSFKRLKESLPIKFSYKPFFSHKKRMIKSDLELEYLQSAVNIGKDSFRKIAKELAKRSGEDEISLSFLSESILRDYGKRALSFEPILAFSENASKPHAQPTKRALKEGDLVLLDAGVKYKRYCSDRTRTAYFDGTKLSFKKKQHFPNRTIQKAYDTLLKAHDKAIEKARSGMKAKKIDKIAREIIEKAGFGEYFVHSTGHGVGLDIHEMPYISSSSETIIEDSMVFTIEPGIYVEGEFGIRIEDMVVMHHGRAEIL